MLELYKYCNKEDEHVLKFWNKSEIKTMKYCHNLYLKCDVLLLADVFEKFRNSRLQNHGLLPSLYLSAPTLSWDAMHLLKMLTCIYSFFFSKKLRELHNDYPSALDKIEIKRKVLSNCQLKVTDFYNSPIGNIKNLVPNFFDNKSICFIMETGNFT